jgi:hypothetical protein
MNDTALGVAIGIASVALVFMLIILLAAIGDYTFGTH